MRRSVVACSTIVSLLATAPAAADTLADAITVAYQSNPALLAARADLRAIDEREIQARSAFGPTITSAASVTRNDARVTQPNLLGRAATVHDFADSATYRLSANQSLYDGGRLAATLSVARAEILGGRETLRRTEESILSQVIGAYVDVVLARDLREIARQNDTILQQQVVESDAKAKVREVTLTDQSQTRARLLAAQVRLAEAEAQLGVSEARYAAVVGAAPGPLASPPDLPGIPPRIEAAFDAADAANPTYLGARFAELAARGRARQVRADDGFRVGLALDLSHGPVTNYIANSSVNAATASINLSKPLFSSGLQRSREREADATAAGDELRVRDAQRQAYLAVAQTWAELVTTRSLLADLRAQLEQEKAAFEGSRVEQRIGLRTTIDVLNAEQEYQQTKASLAQKYHDEYLGRVALLSAMGVLQTELIDPTAEVYRPEAWLGHLVRRQPLPWLGVLEAIDAIGWSPLRLDPPRRDPLAAVRTSGTATMPPAPGWSGLTVLLVDVPKPR